MLVFAYGSLMDPSSQARTLPPRTGRAAFPARCDGFERVFGVAFPNDGSQGDKEYLASDGRRPPFVLFCDIIPKAGSSVNGICLRLEQAELDLLGDRERRYRLVRLDGLAVSWDGQPLGDVWAFVGLPRFTKPAALSEGVVPAAYLAAVTRGAQHWEQRYPGFLEEFRASTVLPAAERVTELERVDL